MARKKAGSSKKEVESAKPIDRTQITVALIGLVGTIAVAVIALLGNKTPEKPAENIETTSSQNADAPTINDPFTITPQAQIEANPDSIEGCVGEYFANVAPENQNSMEVGLKIYMPIKSQSGNTFGPFGVQLTENGRFIGAIQFLVFTDSASFKITSVVDSNCTQIADYGNYDVPLKQAAIDNWGNLGFQLTSGKYRLRMGLISSKEIELLFTSN